MNKVLSNLSEAEMMSLFLNQEQESSIGDMHSQQSYSEHVDHEVLCAVRAMNDEIVSESGGMSSKTHLEQAVQVFIDLVWADHQDKCADQQADNVPF